ncbi:MAG: ATP-binding protein, partial [Firmicutes bacterium]|nr:ATP-binding protein [Bacillota bacterium]
FRTAAEILFEYINVSLAKNKTDLIYALFGSFLSSDECKGYVPDYTSVSRWLSGKRDLPIELKAYYDSTHKENLRADIENNIYPETTDYPKLSAELKNLIMSDVSISSAKREYFSNMYLSSQQDEKAAIEFLTEIIYFSLNRSNTIQEEKSVSVKDIILNCKPPKPCKYFSGRSEELENLHTLLADNDKIFVQGIAGIGKSEFVKAYADIYKKDYTNIIYLVYSGNLRNDIAYMSFCDDTQEETVGELSNKHLRFLQALKCDTLLIIDNFDNSANDRYVLDVMQLNCKIIFTSRENHHQITVNLTELSGDDIFIGIAKDIFKNADNYREIIIQIADCIYHHTYAFELAMRLLEKGIDTPEELLQKLKSENIRLSATDKIKANKDNKPKKAIYYEHISTLFSIQKLSSEEIKVIRCLAFISVSEMDKRFFAKLINQNDLNVINDLEEYGYIKINDSIVTMHPIIKEIVLNETKPSIRNCSKFLYNIRQHCLRFGEDTKEYKNLFFMIECIIHNIEKDHLRQYLIFLKDTFQYMEKYFYESGMRLIISEMEIIIPKIIMLYPEDKALLYDCKSAVAYQFDNDIQKAIEYETQALNFIEKLTKKNALLVSNLNANLGGLYSITDNYEFAEKHIYDGLHILQQFSIYNHDMAVQICNYTGIAVKRGYSEKALKLLENFAEQFKKENAMLDYAIISEYLGSVYTNLNMYDKANYYLDTALNIYREQLDEDTLKSKSDNIYLMQSHIKLLENKK